MMLQALGATVESSLLPLPHLDSSTSSYAGSFFNQQSTLHLGVLEEGQPSSRPGKKSTTKSNGVPRSPYFHTYNMFSFVVYHWSIYRLREPGRGEVDK